MNPQNLLHYGSLWTEYYHDEQAFDTLLLSY